MEQQPEIMDFKDIDISNPMIINQQPYRRRRCSLIVTLGFSFILIEVHFRTRVSSSALLLCELLEELVANADNALSLCFNIADPGITQVDIQRLLEAGTNIAKFRMSYTTMGDKLRLLGNLDKAALACCKKHFINDWPVATCVELKTCIVKTGMLETDKEFIIINEGNEVVLTSNFGDYNKCNENIIFVDNYYMTTDINVGTEISIDSEEIILQCTQVIDEKCVKCMVVKGGKLANLCDVCARIAKHTRPYVSKHDLDIVKFAVEYQVDMIIINYSRHKDTLKKIKQYLGKKLKRPLLICGICSQEGLNNFDDIIKESDGIILSREYLPYELEHSQRNTLPRIQKWMAAKCLQAGKPLYISGVFRNAILNGIFDDNEISDVTNAILDGASGFLLKGCINSENVLEVLNAMNHLSYTVDPLLTSRTGFWRVAEEFQTPINAAEAAVMACALTANVTNASLVIIPTVTGKTIQALHSLRLSCIVITLSTNNRATRLLNTYRGIYPILYAGSSQKNWSANVEARVNFAIEYAVKRAWVTYGDTYVTLHRDSELSSFCDTVRVWKVAIAKKSLVECPDGSEEESD